MAGLLSLAGERSSSRDLPVGLKLQLAIGPLEYTCPAQGSCKSKTCIVYFVLEQRDLCSPISPFLEMPSNHGLLYQLEAGIDPLILFLSLKPLMS